MKQELNLKDSFVSFCSGLIFGQLIVVALVFVITLFGSTAGYSIESVSNFLQNNHGIGLLISTFAMDLVFVLIFLSYKLKRNNPVVDNYSTKKLFIYIGVAILSYFVLYPIVCSFNKLLSLCGLQLTSLSLQKQDYPYAIFSLVLLPAISEELLFRATIFKGLKKYGKALSIVLSAILFALFHLSYEQLLYPILMGIIFAVIMYKENNILYTIAMHITSNALSLIFSYFNLSLFFDHFAYYILAIVLFAMYLYVIIKILAKKDGQTTTKLSKIEMYTAISCLIIITILWVLINLATIMG